MTDAITPTRSDEPEDLLAWPSPAPSPDDGWDSNAATWNGPFRRPGAIRFGASGRTRLEAWGKPGYLHRDDGPALLWHAGGRIKQAWYRHNQRYNPTLAEQQAWRGAEERTGSPFHYPDRTAFRAAQAIDPALAQNRPPPIEATLRAAGKWDPHFAFARVGGIKDAAAAAAAARAAPRARESESR
jgi:hypothetical protein